MQAVLQYPIGKCERMKNPRPRAFINTLAAVPASLAAAVAPLTPRPSPCSQVKCCDGIMRRDVQGLAGVSKRKSRADPPIRVLLLIAV